MAPCHSKHHMKNQLCFLVTAMQYLTYCDTRVNVLCKVVIITVFLSITI